MNNNTYQIIHRAIALIPALLRRHCSLVLTVSMLILTLLTPPLESSGETLKDILASDAMSDFRAKEGQGVGKIGKGGKRQPPPNPVLRGINPDTTFATIWTTKMGPNNLLIWIGAKLPFYKYRKPAASRTDDMVTAEVLLVTSNRTVYRLTIMIPHPSILPLAEAQVLSEFRKLRPPALPVLSEKTVPLADGTGTLYEHKNGACSLVIPIERGGLVHISTQDFKNGTTVIEIAKELDLDRLNRKLSS